MCRRGVCCSLAELHRTLSLTVPIALPSLRLSPSLSAAGRSTSSSSTNRRMMPAALAFFFCTTRNLSHAPPSARIHTPLPLFDNSFPPPAPSQTLYTIIVRAQYHTRDLILLFPALFECLSWCALAWLLAARGRAGVHRKPASESRRAASQSLGHPTQSAGRGQQPRPYRYECSVRVLRCVG